MLSVKHIENDGRETLFDAPYGVEFRDKTDATPAQVHIFRTDGPHPSPVKALRGGTVYVMNSTGKTVSTYRLESISPSSDSFS